jgi:putative transposase
MRFRFIEEHKGSFPAKRLCHVVGVSTRGLRAFRSRPASQRQRSDLVTLARIKEQSRLSLDSYGRPRMTEELKEIGLDVGHPLPAGDCLQSPIWSCGSFDAPERHIRG